MAVPSWPSAVPHASERAGATGSQNYAPPRSAETEGGPPLLRPQPGPRVSEQTWRRYLTEAQFAAFETFVLTDLRQGTRVFTMPVFKPGSGYVSRHCEIKGGTYSADFSGGIETLVGFTLTIYDL